MASTYGARLATPEEQAKYGHSAALLRQLLKDRNWKVGDLMTELGIKDNNPHIYQMLAAKGGVGPRYLNKLAKLIGCKPEELLSHTKDRGAVARVKKAKEAKEAKVSGTRTLTTRSDGPDGPQLSFRINGDGTVRIVVDMTMPLAKATKHIEWLVALAQELDADAVHGASVPGAP